MTTACSSPNEWRAAGATAHIRGHQIFFLDSGGASPPLLVIHGFPTAGWDFHAVHPHLAANCRVVIPDMLGFGFSDKPRQHRYSIAEQADILEALMDELGLAAFRILAHDYGDTVAQELLARDIERFEPSRRIASVCFLNGGLFPETHRARTVQKLLASPIGPLVSRLTTKRQFARGISAVFGPRTQPSPREIDGFWQLITHGDGRHVFSSLIGYMAERRANRDRWVKALTDAPCPVQLINGSDDPVSGAHMVARYRELVQRRDDIVELPGIGHYPQVEAPEAVIEAYLAFLAVGGRG